MIIKKSKEENSWKFYGQERGWDRERSKSETLLKPPILET